MKPRLEGLQQLYDRKDVIADLPTGHGKSFIIQLLVPLEQKRNNHSTVLIVCPLTRIINDQITEVQSIGLSACNLAGNLDKLQDIEAGKFNIVYASTESIIDRRFLASLKKDSNRIILLPSFPQMLDACLLTMIV